MGSSSNSAEECWLCSDYFLSTSDLNDHVKRCHFNYAPFKCGHRGCSFSAASQEIIELHTTMKHGKVEKIFVLSDDFIDLTLYNDVCKAPSTTAAANNNRKLDLRKPSLKSFARFTKKIDDLERIKWSKKKIDLKTKPFKRSVSHDLTQPGKRVIFAKKVETESVMKVAGVKFSLKCEPNGPVEFQEVLGEQRREKLATKYTSKTVKRSAAVSHDMDQAGQWVIFAKKANTEPGTEEAGVKIFLKHHPNGHVELNKMLCDQQQKIPEDGETSLANCTPKTVEHGKRRCALCPVSVMNYANYKRRHCISHLRIKKGCGKLLYQCLLCPLEGSCEANYVSDMKQHVQQKHAVSIPETGTHFIDRSIEYKDQILAMIKRCFP